MSLDPLFLVPVVVGHAALFALATNVVHAFGHTETPLARAKAALIAAFLAASVALAWGAWSGPFLAWPWPLRTYGAVCLAFGLLGLPASSAYLRLRRRPDGIKGRENVIDLAGRYGAEALTGRGRYARLLNLPGNQSFRLRKAEWEMALPALPAALDGLTVLHLSDLHLAPCFDRRFFEAVADEAAEWAPDLVLFTGDLVDHEDAVDWLVPVLARVRGSLGSFAVLGNHDLDHRPERLRRLVGEAGFVDLEGQWATLSASGRTVALGGTSYPWGPQLPIEGRPEADVHVLLSHTPDRFYWAERAGFDLMVSGHNHGGQVRLPFVGPVLMPSVYSRRFDRGFFRKNGLTLHVSQGVAGKHPIRYGCPPEVSLLVLRAATPDRAAAAHARGRVERLSVPR